MSVESSRPASPFLALGFFFGWSSNIRITLHIKDAGEVSASAGMSGLESIYEFIHTANIVIHAYYYTTILPYFIFKSLRPLTVRTITMRIAK